MKMKRFLAGLLSAAMILGSTMTAFAADGDHAQEDATSANKGGVSADGKVEGWADTDVFEVRIPTINKADLAMIIDPQKLINETNGAAHGGATFSNSTLFFNNGGNYSDTTNTFTITNLSAVSINVGLSVTVSDNGAISLNSTSANATGPSIWLAVSTNNTSDSPAVKTDFTAAGRTVLEDGCNIDEIVKKAPDGVYKITYEATKYAYKADKSDMTKFKTLEFSIKGAAVSKNAAGETISYKDVVGVKPVLNVVWDIKAVGGEATELVCTKITNTSGSTTYATKADLATRLKSGAVVFNVSAADATTIKGLTADRIVIDGKDYSYSYASTTNTTSDGYAYTLVGFTASNASVVEVYYKVSGADYVVKITL